MRISSHPDSLYAYRAEDFLSCFSIYLISDLPPVLKISDMYNALSLISDRSVLDFYSGILIFIHNLILLTFIC